MLLFGGLLPSHGRQEKILSLHGHGSFITYILRGGSPLMTFAPKKTCLGTCVAFIVGIKFEGHGPKTDTS